MGNSTWHIGQFCCLGLCLVPCATVSCSAVPTEQRPHVEIALCLHSSWYRIGYRAKPCVPVTIGDVVGPGSTWGRQEVPENAGLKARRIYWDDGSSMEITPIDWWK